MLHELLNSLEETLFMVFTAGLLTWIIGLPLGTLLSVTRSEQFLDNYLLHKILKVFINTTSSIPYIILMVAAIPLTRLLVGTEEGSLAAIVPLTLAAVPQFAKLTAAALDKIPKGLIEAAESVGASPLQIIYKVLIPEALPNIINILTSTLVQLVGYSAIAGALGAGGLGGLAVLKGYSSFQADYVLAVLIVLMAIIQIIQVCGDYIVYGTFKKQ
jgi:D-methionine transport system permease protein